MLNRLAACAFVTHVTKQGGEQRETALTLSPAVGVDMLDKVNRLEAELGCD